MSRERSEEERGREVSFGRPRVRERRGKRNESRTESFDSPVPSETCEEDEPT